MPKPLAVHIVRDTASPLWVIRCVQPCGYRERTGWCQDEIKAAPPTCWLGSAGTETAAAAMARGYGYAVPA